MSTFNSAEKMDDRTLEITLHYARDLNNVNLITKMDVYAVVSIAGGDKSSNQKTKTPVDHDGNTNPTWDFPMKFTVDEAALQMNRLTLDFQLICERALGDKDVGEVHVPMKELLYFPAKYTGADGKQFVSYQVRKPSGKPKGQLHFSYQFGKKIVGAAGEPPCESAISFAPPPRKGDPEHVMAYPAVSSSFYPPYPPPPAYPATEGKVHYPLVGVYPSAGGGARLPGGYPPPPPPLGYGYPPPGYGYPPQPGYGYPRPPAAKNNKFGLGLGAGLLGGAIGGLLVGDMISDADDFDCGFDF